MPHCTVTSIAYILFHAPSHHSELPSFPTRRSSDLVRYPEVKRDYAKNFRGMHSLKRDEQGRERCTACGLCALSCPAEDRKSTRLNSSHVSISYAVFCLKKKNYTNIPRATRVCTHRQ